MCGAAAFSATMSSATQLPPRVLLVMPDRWPRALLRAALRNAGYDAVGASSLGRALRIRADEPSRGAVCLVIVDQSALHDASDAEQLDQLLSRYRASDDAPRPGDGGIANREVAARATTAGQRRRHRDGHGRAAALARRTPSSTRLIARPRRKCAREVGVRESDVLAFPTPPP